MTYAELQVTTHFSFLRGASSAEELFAQAAMLGIPALGVVDRNSLAGIVRAHDAAKTTGVRLVVGCRLDLEDGTAMLVYPTDRAAYSRLCRLLSIGKGRAGKGACRLGWDDVAAWGEGQIVVFVPGRIDDGLAGRLRRLKSDFGDRAYLALTRRFRPNDALRLYRLEETARAARVPTVATNDVLYHAPERRMLQDVVTCIREGCTIDNAGFRRERFADRFLKPPAEMARLFERHPDAIARTTEIAERCTFSLSELEYQYPSEVVEAGLTAQDTLEKLTWEGTKDRYPEGLPDKVAAQIRHELNLIDRLGYAPYFLTVNSIVRFARSKGILCQGRGSAANSAVCFVLGITSIDPVRSGLLFERFVSEERREPPDIDVDFEHERREEVIQWIYETYGRHRAALTATVIRYRSRGAVREVGKAMGLPEDVTAALAGLIWAWSDEGVGEVEARDLNLNLSDRRLKLTLELASQLIGTPRHLSQHPGGFVLTQDRLDDLVPIEPAAMENRQVIEWDKDDIDTLKFMKVDVLGLGMLGCMRRCFDLLAEHKGVKRDLATVPPEDEATYEMIRNADTVGVFQIESRAQMAMLPRMKPKTFYDLVIEVAIVTARPDPGRHGPSLPSAPRRAGSLSLIRPKRSSACSRRPSGCRSSKSRPCRLQSSRPGSPPRKPTSFGAPWGRSSSPTASSISTTSSCTGMIANGYPSEFAERTFKQLEGFGSYGFPESHAASFALIAYASSWMKCHHPDVFLAAILNAQPMGFYAPAQLVRDAERHGVEIRPPDINHSRWDCTLEPADGGRFAVRLGLRTARGLANRDGASIVAARHDAFASVEDLWRRAGVPVAALERLAEADAFGSLGLGRRQALWEVRALGGEPLPLFAAADKRRGSLRPEVEEERVELAPMTAGREVVEDYRSRGLTLRSHPVAFLRGDLAANGYVPAGDLSATRDGRRVSVAGLVLVRQRPGSANGVLFVTLEDETDIANLIIWPSLFERQRRLVLSANMIGCRGKVQREGQVIHVIAEHLIDLSGLLGAVGEREEVFPLPHGRGDEAKHGSGPDPRDALGRKPRDIYIPDLRIEGAINVKTRDFR